MPLDPRLMEAAGRVKCQRCEVTILEDGSTAGAIIGQFYQPGSGLKHQYALCGKCGLAFLEFLAPALSADPEFHRERAALFEEWG